MRVSAENGSGRRHHLDAIRVSAILLLIPYHAARYVQKGDGDPRIVDAAVWFVHTWHMPLFFAISGFLAASALRRSTAARQVRARFRRLGVPLVVGMLTVVPLANFFVIEAAALWPRKGALPAKRELDLANIFSFTPRHLWFISYLLIVSLLAIGIWLAVKRAPRVGAAVTAAFGRLMRSWWAVPALASISAAILATKTGWVAGGSESNSLIPTPTLFVYFGFFFGFGWLLSGQSNLIEELKRGAWVRLGVGALIAVPAFLLFYNNGDFTGNTGTPGALADIGALRIYALFAVGVVCWLTLFGIWGVLARHVRKESRVLRYLADASFWIYLVHIPFLVALQSTLSTTDLAIPARWGLAVSGTFALALGSYALARESRRQVGIARARHSARRSTSLPTAPERDKSTEAIENPQRPEVPQGVSLL
jgi:peptidoglycan/LPS O-acetylase OafA/YrhL